MARYGFVEVLARPKLSFMPPFGALLVSVEADAPDGGVVAAPDGGVVAAPDGGVGGGDEGGAVDDEGGVDDDEGGVDMDDVSERVMPV